MSIPFSMLIKGFLVFLNIFIWISTINGQDGPITVGLSPMNSTMHSNVIPNHHYFENNKLYVLGSTNIVAYGMHLFDLESNIQCPDRYQATLSRRTVGNLIIEPTSWWRDGEVWGNVRLQMSSNFTGNFNITVERKNRWWLFGWCNEDPWGIISNYNFCKLVPNQSGVGVAQIVGGNSTIVANSSQQASFSLVWRDPAANYCTEVITQMCVKLINYNGQTSYESFQCQSISILNAGDPWTLGTFSKSVTGYGTYVFDVKVKDKFGQEHPLTPVSIEVVPNCHFDPTPTVTLSGAVEIEKGYPNIYGGYKLEKNIDHLLNLHSNQITDFNNNYNVTVDDGAANPSPVGYDHVEIYPTTTPGQFRIKIKDDIGSYRIFVQKKEHLQSYCRSYSNINLFVGGSNEVVHRNCIIYIPQDIPNLFPDINSEFGTRTILSHFTYVVSSNKGIIVQPGSNGVILQAGAQLILQPLPLEQPSPELADNDLNWQQTRLYDDKGKVISESKQFFDNRGRPVQLQAKSLSKKVVLATENIYDKYGRLAITTLPAPITGSTITEAVDECGDRIQAGQDMYFIYKENFITANNQKYSFTNFDNFRTTSGITATKLNNPDPIDNNTVGTLGWYYQMQNKTGATVDNSLGQNRFIEPHTPVSSYPYSRTSFHVDGTGRVKNSTVPGNRHRMGTGHYSEINQFPIEVQDEQVISDYLQVRSLEVFPQLPPVNSLSNNAFKNYLHDVEGNEIYEFITKDGNSLITQNLTAGEISWKFYNDFGQLVHSVSPNGYLQYTNGIPFADLDKTSYFYNFKGELIKIIEKDAGIREYMYRKDGSLRFAQNSIQKSEGKFSYVNYDEVGRPIETGEFIPCSTCNSQFKSEYLISILEETGLNDPLNNQGSKSDMLITIYDVPVPAAPIQQEYLLGQISYTEKVGVNKTWYSYDDRSRIKETVQEIMGLPGYKVVEYKYNASGQVEEVAYQRNTPSERFFHVYQYDEDSRLKKVFTSTNVPTYNNIGILDTLLNFDLKKAAEYRYYIHGPLKRIELNKTIVTTVTIPGFPFNRTYTYNSNSVIQGIDYVYTIQGWIKAINNHDKANDFGGDLNDAFGMTFHYHTNDHYVKSGAQSPNLYITSHPDYYNGRMKAAAWFSKKPSDPSSVNSVNAYLFTYDAKNQLTNSSMRAVNVLQQSVSIGSGESENKFREGELTYDANGNIKSLIRYDAAGDILHNFTEYHYAPNSNQLKNIEGLEKNYNYNSNGTINTITSTGYSQTFGYDSYSRITNLYTSSPYLNLDITYNDKGLRNSKSINSGLVNSYYVYDAFGSLLAIYDNNNQNSALQLAELPIYGSGRIGVLLKNSRQPTYEITDHLGNVRVLLDHLGNSIGYTDYYPFGLEMAKEDPGSYRYGYQGQFSEEDETGYNSFQLRMYDPVIGRWLGVDPMRQFYSGYVGMGNNPVSGIDPTGGEVPWYKNGDNYFWTEEEADLGSGWEKVSNDYNYQLPDNAKVWGSLSAVTLHGDVGDPHWLSNPELYGTPSAQQSSMYQFADDLAYWSSTLISSAMGGFAEAGLASGVSLLSRHAAAKGSGRVFWSGGDIAKNSAMSFAKTNGLKTLEMTTGGRIMNTVSPYLPRSISSPIWDGLSRNFARGASGNINVFQNAAGVSLRSTWRRIEYPILRNNNIIFHTVK